MVVTGMIMQEIRKPKTLSDDAEFKKKKSSGCSWPISFDAEARHELVCQLLGHF
jgi:hypothetical protein